MRAALFAISIIVVVGCKSSDPGGAGATGGGSDGSNGAAGSNGAVGSNGVSGNAANRTRGSNGASGENGPGSGSGSSGPAPEYRTADSKPPVDPALAGVGKTFMVVSESVDATKVGKDILANGGNAVDAIVGVAFALAVVHQSAGNIAGGGFAVVRLGPQKFESIDFRETAPAKATTNMYVDESGNVSQDSLIGHRASGIPGTVAGLAALHQKHGKLPWKTVIAPSIALARDGFILDKIQAGSIAYLKDRMAKFPTTAAIWLPGGQPAKEGDKIVIPDLAATLERIAAQGADGFYKGKTAELIVAEMERGKGLITKEDLAGYKAEWREPLHFSYRGNDVFSMPPPSSGGIVLAMTANILSHVEVGKLPWHGVDHIHWLVEAWRRGFAARNELLGDPSFVKNPTEKLISMAYADELAKTITDTATPSKAMQGLLEGNHTTNLVVVDGKGMAVSMTTTINTSFGSLVTVGGGGFLMNNEMDDFAAKPGSPNTFGLVQGKANQIEPGKRMLSSMAPTLVENAKHELILALGARGGPRIITAVWQSMSNVIDFGMSASEAVAAARIHFQHLPDVVRYERETIDKATEDELIKRGYAGGWGEIPREFASTTLVVRTKDGTWSGAADHRGGGAAMGD